MAYISNSQVAEMVVKSYFRRLTTGKLDKGGIDRNPAVLITGPTGTGKSTGVYQAAEIIAEKLGKKLFIYGQDKITVDVDELAWKYKQMYDKIRKVTSLVFNEKEDAYEIDREILAGIVRDTFMDITLDELFEMLDAIGTHKLEPPKELEELKAKRKELIDKLISGNITEEEMIELDEIEEKIKKIRENAINGLFVVVDFDLNQVEAVDLTGVIVKTSVGFRYLPPLWALLLRRHGGILFLDEFTNIESNEKRSIAYRIVHNKKIGEIFLDRHVLVVAAGNTTKDSSIASELPWPLMNRFGHFEITNIDKNGVVNYFIKKYGWSKAALKAISFIAANSDSVLFNLPKTGTGSESKETLRPFETPRSWEFVIRDLIALNGDVDPDSEETRMLLELYGLKPGELVDNAEGNKDIMHIVATIASEYISQSIADAFATQWIERVLSPEELFKNPELFRQKYGREGEMSIAALQSAFMYAQWMTQELAKEINKVFGGSGKKRRIAGKKLTNKILNEVLPKYIKPIQVMGSVSMEYVTFVAGLIASTAGKVDGVNVHYWVTVGLVKTPDIGKKFQEVIKKVAIGL